MGSTYDRELCRELGYKYRVRVPHVLPPRSRNILDMARSYRMRDSRHPNHWAATQAVPISHVTHRPFSMLPCCSRGEHVGTDKSHTNTCGSYACASAIDVSASSFEIHSSDCSGNTNKGRTNPAQQASWFEVDASKLLDTGRIHDRERRTDPPRSACEKPTGITGTSEWDPDEYHR